MRAGGGSSTAALKVTHYGGGGRGEGVFGRMFKYITCITDPSL